ncbi:MAG: hypothetical protein HKO87_03950 [Acidimicrobiia bacterium]|nr:hypothetical protein [Acidimicrobiia bacterium]NNK91564.1 hypothetical protein [Acidimicrobiia bacterium]
MTQTVDRQATKVRPPRREVPQRIEPVRRQRRGYFAWMVSLVVLLVIAAAGFIVLQYIEETEVLPASGESVYAEFDWYENLEGFYLTPPAAVPSGESVYSGYGWYNHLDGFYLAPPAAVGMGEIVYSEFDWYSDLGMYLRPPFSATQSGIREWPQEVIQGPYSIKGPI